MQLDRLSILGVGLLGGSIGLAVKSLAKSCKVIGYGHNPATLDKAVSLGAIDEGHTDLAKAVGGSDLIILCTPVGLFPSLIRDMAPALDPGAIVTDVGSTKRSVVAAAARLPGSVRFVASHPMAGSEKRGVAFARADLFRGAPCILTPTADTDPAALAAVQSFWTLLGMRLSRLSPEDHDRLMGQISHVPHAVAAALVMLQDEATLPLAGPGFLDATRIAAGDPALWRDIFLDNRDNLLNSLAHLQRQLAIVRSLLDRPDVDGLKQFLEAAAKRRAQLTPARDPT